MALIVSNLSKRGKEKWSVRDFSITAGQGEVLGILSDSSESVMDVLDLLSGDARSAGGSIKFNEVDLTNKSFSSRGFVLNRKRKGFLAKLLDSNRISPDQNIKQLLNDAATGSSVLMLHEPYRLLDRIQTLEAIMSVRETTQKLNLVTIIASTRFDELLPSCDKVVVLENGDTVQIGKPDEVYLSPHSRYVAQLTGRTNLIEARRITSSRSDNPEFQTLTASHTLSLSKVGLKHLGAINENVWLSIRPEHISISFGASFPEDNLLKATITDVHFLGPVTLVGLEADGLRLESLVLRLVGLNVGDECMIGLPPDRLTILTR